MHWRLLGAIIALVTASCGSGNEDDTDRLRVVTTVAPITSIVASVVGDRADVVGIVPEGTNSHTFEPPPSAAEILVFADVVFLNGLQLEEPTKRLIDTNTADATPVVELGDRTLDPGDYKYDFSFPESRGRPNPHLWTDPRLVITYAGIIRDTMVEVDPAGRSAYVANHDAFVDLIAAFDEAARASFDTVPQEHRKLVTYHDAYAYMADTYDWTVIGAMQPADFGEPSPREIVRLIEQIEAEGIPAIFGSEVFPSAVLEQIGNETGVRYVDELRDDDLPGDPGDAEHSWLGLMRVNFITMTTALGGDAAPLVNLSLGSATNDSATYPQ